MSDERPWTRRTTRAADELRRRTIERPTVNRTAGARSPATPGLPGDAAAEDVPLRYDVFVAHAAGDTEAAEALYERLSGRGLRVFLATKSPPASEEGDDRLASAQAASAVTAVLISKLANRSFYNQPEVAGALALAGRPTGGRHVVPVQLAASNPPVPAELRRVQSVSAAGGWDHAVDTIVGLVHPGAATPAAPSSREAPTPSRREAPASSSRRDTPVPSSREAHAPSAPRIWSPRVPVLPKVTVARPELLAKLDGDGAAHVQVLVGPGGMGTSTAAALYAWHRRQAADVDIVWWVRARDPLTLVRDLADLAPQIGVATDAHDVDAVATSVVTRLETTPERWILVLDDATSPKDVERWLPAGGTGRVVITSRDTGWAALGDQRSVTPFDRASSVEFLNERTGDANPDGADDATGLGLVAARLGGLPLALEQAGSVMDHPKRTWRAYSRAFNEVRSAGGPGDRAVGHEATAATTTRISLHGATADSPLAPRLAAACGFLAGDEVPFDLFADQTVAADPFLHASVSQVRSALDTLCDYAIAVPQGGSLRFHPIVQDVAREAGPPDTLDFVARTLRHHFPDPDQRDAWPRCAELAPHVIAAARHADEVELATPLDLWWIVDDVANYYVATGNVSAAVAVHETALSVARSNLDAGDPNLITARNNLALSYHLAGRTDDAIELQEQVLSAREQAAGPPTTPTPSTRRATSPATTPRPAAPATPSSSRSACSPRASSASAPTTPTRGRHATTWPPSTRRPSSRARTASAATGSWPASPSVSCRRRSRGPEP